MKRLFLASLVFALAPTASAQEMSVEFRQGDAFRGPVKSARIESAAFVRRDGQLVEGPRRLVSVINYAPDGKRREQETYAPDGKSVNKTVSVYDDAGNEVEMSMFDGRGELRMKRVYRPAAGETLTYNGDESLRERRVVVARPDGTQAEVLTYDGSGALVERSVNERDGKTSVWSTYRADGSLKERAVHALNYGGPHHTEKETYAPDGSVAGRRVSNVDAAVSDLRAAEERGDGAPPRRTRDTREYDSRRNLIKNVQYRWNAEAGEYEPTLAYYSAIEYYR
jgi:hypothetical protein